jgi:hypothetical protein
MGYLHINNLYKDKRIFDFKQCYALEKIHGSSSHISWKAPDNLTFFAGGEKHQNFIALFDIEMLKQKFSEATLDNCIIYGEVYGGRCQGMSETYGKSLKFVAFDVYINECWLSVPRADLFVKNYGLEFVDYALISTDLADIDKQRERPSTQAIRNGISTIDENGIIVNPKRREGVVLRPITEYRDNNNERIISKHKNDEFKETNTSRSVTDEIPVLNVAKEIAIEWVTPIRLEHVLQKLPSDIDITKMPVILDAMVEDVLREGAGELIDSKDLRGQIKSLTAKLYKKKLQEDLKL